MTTLTQCQPSTEHASSGGAPSSLLEELVMSLPRAERARLAERLIVSLDEGSLDEESEVEEAWVAEIRRRSEEIDRGEVELIPAEQVFTELDVILKK